MQGESSSSFSHSPGLIVRCPRWAGGLRDGGSGVENKRGTGVKARGHLSRGFLTVRIFSQQSFCKTTSRAKRRDILACRRTDIVALGDERTTLKKKEAFFTLLFLESVCFLLVYILFITTTMRGRSMSFLSYATTSPHFSAVHTTYACHRQLVGMGRRWTMS